VFSLDHLNDDDESQTPSLELLGAHAESLAWLSALVEVASSLFAPLAADAFKLVVDTSMRYETLFGGWLALCKSFARTKFRPKTTPCRLRAHPQLAARRARRCTVRRSSARADHAALAR